MIWGSDIFQHLFQIALSNTFELFSNAFGEKVESTTDVAHIFMKYSTQEIEYKYRNHWVLRSFFDEMGFNSWADLVNAASRGNYVHPELAKDFSKLPYEIQISASLSGKIQGLFLALGGAETSATKMNIDFNIPKSLWTFNKFRIQQIEAKFSELGVRDEVPIQAAIMSKKMDWMGAATVEDLVKMREQGLLEKLREIYRIKRRELQRASPDNFEAATNAVVESVTQALQECMDEIKKMERDKSRGWFSQIAKFIVSGSFGLAGTVYPSFGLFSLLYSFLGPGASATDLYFEHKKNKDKQEKLANQPIAHMLEIWKRAENMEDKQET